MDSRLISSGLLLFATLAVQAQAPPATKPADPARPPMLRTEEKQPISPQPIPASMALSELQGRSLQSWLQDLKHSDPSVREQAISVLPLFGEAIDTHDVLTQLLDRCNYDRDASPRIRALMVVNSLPEIKPTDVPRVVQMLTKGLSDQQSQIRYYSAIGLARYGHEARGAIGALAGIAEDGPQSPTFDLRRAALATLAIVARDPGKSPDKRAVIAMTKGSIDSAVAVRLEAAKGLGMLGRVTDPMVLSTVQPLVEKALQNFSRDKDQRVVIWGTISAMALDKVDPAKIQSIAGFLRSPDVSIRQHAALALAAIGPHNKPVLDKVIAALQDKDSGVAVNALGALLASEEKGPEVLMALKDLHDKKETPEGLKYLAQAATEAITRRRPNNPAPAPKK